MAEKEFHPRRTRRAPIQQAGGSLQLLEKAVHHGGHGFTQIYTEKILDRITKTRKYEGNEKGQ
jgi:hypothetical protein